jgi:DUF1680 family protein
MPELENRKTLSAEMFEAPGDLPVAWKLTGDLHASQGGRIMAGVGGSFEGTAETCLHLIKFRGPRGSMGLARGLELDARDAVTVSFRMATCYRGVRTMLTGAYSGREPGFRVCLRGPSGDTTVAMQLAGEEGKVLLDGTDTGRALPMLVWRRFSLGIDAPEKTARLYIDDQPVGQAVAAEGLAGGVAEIGFELPEDEEGYAALWLDRFAVREGIGAAIDDADGVPRNPGGGAGLPAGNRISSFEPGKVRATGHIGARLDLAIHRNAMALDVEGDFLAPYAQLGEEGPKGREELEQGVFVGSGSLLDALARMACYSQDPAVVEATGRLAERLANIQRENGYIGVYPEDAGKCPLFTEFCLHDAVYLILGFARDYRLNDREKSLASARKLAAYVTKNWPLRPQGPTFTPLGINEAFLELFRVDGNRELLEFIGHQRGGKQWTIQNASLLDWDQEVWRGGHPDRNTPQGGEAAARHSIVHVYRLYERCMAQLMLNEIEPDERLTVMPRRVIELLRSPEKTGMLITGASGNNEGWENTQLCTGKTGETCTTVYGIWFTEALLKHTGDLGWGGWMERMIYNSLFCAQEPEGRRLRYFSPPSGKREYYHRDTYCCPNNFRRGMVRLPEHIYYRDGRGLVVNLFEASEAEIEVVPGTSVRLRQVTEYPAEETAAILLDEVNGPTEFGVALRIPAWCQGAAVTVNGEPAASTIEREWQAGDRIDVRLPMAWRLVRGRCLQAGRAAVMRGPLVYCLSRELNNLPEEMVLRDITLDPVSIETAERDARGVLNKPICRVRAWSPGRDPHDGPDLTLKLHEFPEPTGEEIYFRVSDEAVLVDDELFAGGADSEQSRGAFHD